MNLTVGGTLASFAVACLAYWLFDKVIDVLIKRPDANEIFHVILIIFCVVIALAGSVFIKL